MSNSNNRNRGELAKAESTLQEFEEKIERLRVMMKERKAERRKVETEVQEAAAEGDMDRLVALQSRCVTIERSLAEMSAAESECLERMLAARRYLYTLYVRLEKLRQEASSIRRKLLAPDEPLSAEERTSLNRLKIQIKAITGESQTGQLL
jgi:hypothetical protein